MSVPGNGRVSMLDRKLADFDMEKARIRAQAQYDGLIAKYPERSWNHPPVAEIFPPSYPIEGNADG